MFQTLESNGLTLKVGDLSSRKKYLFNYGHPKHSLHHKNHVLEFALKSNNINKMEQT